MFYQGGLPKAFLSGKASRECSDQGGLVESVPIQEGCDETALCPETLPNVFGVYMLLGFSCNMRTTLFSITTAVFWMSFLECRILVSC